MIECVDCWTFAFKNRDEGDAHPNARHFMSMDQIEKRFFAKKGKILIYVSQTYVGKKV